VRRVEHAAGTLAQHREGGGRQRPVTAGQMRSRNHAAPSRFGGQCSPPRNVTRNGRLRMMRGREPGSAAIGITTSRVPRSVPGPSTAHADPPPSPTPRDRTPARLALVGRKPRGFAVQGCPDYDVAMVLGHPAGHLEHGVVLIEDPEPDRKVILHAVGRHPQLVGVQRVERAVAGEAPDGPPHRRQVVPQHQERRARPQAADAVARVPESRPRRWGPSPPTRTGALAPRRALPGHRDARTTPGARRARPRPGSAGRSTPALSVPRPGEAAAPV
jgi:hypothetical protein